MNQLTIFAHIDMRISAAVLIKANELHSYVKENPVKREFARELYRITIRVTSFESKLK